MKLEGRLVGPWAAELGRSWKEKFAFAASKKLLIDICNTTFVDADGLGVLRDIYSRTGAELLTNSPWTQYLAEEVKSAKAPTEI